MGKVVRENVEKSTIRFVETLVEIGRTGLAEPGLTLVEIPTYDAPLFGNPRNRMY